MAEIDSLPDINDPTVLVFHQVAARLFRNGTENILDVVRGLHGRKIVSQRAGREFDFPPGLSIFLPRQEG
jgi:hypothetical protein